MKKTITLTSTKKQEIREITEEVKGIVKESKVKEGICLVYVPHATAAVIINENADPEISQDLINCLNRLVPGGQWLHDRIDDNGDAHLKSALLGPAKTLVIEKGELVLGRWQAIMVADFDGPRKREVIVKIMEGP